MIVEIATYSLVFAAVVVAIFVVVQTFRTLDGTGWLSYLGPRWVAHYRERQRRQAFESKILDLTMGLAGAMKAGMALPQALEKVGAQMGGGDARRNRNHVAGVPPWYQYRRCDGAVGDADAV